MLLTDNIPASLLTMYVEKAIIINNDCQPNFTKEQTSNHSDRVEKKEKHCSSNQ